MLQLTYRPKFYIRPSLWDKFSEDLKRRLTIDADYIHDMYEYEFQKQYRVPRKLLVC